jgi:hypothetical protein
MLDAMTNWAVASISILVNILSSGFIVLGRVRLAVKGREATRAIPILVRTENISLYK